MELIRKVSSLSKKGLVGILAAGALAGGANDAKANVFVKWWVSEKGTNSPDFYLPQDKLYSGDKAYLYVAADTTEAAGTSFYYASWQVFTPVISGLGNVVQKFDTNFFTATTLFNQSFYDSAWTGYNLNTSSLSTKMDQTTNTAGRIVNSYATITPTTTGFHDVTSDFPSASQGGLMAIYQFTVNPAVSLVGTMTNFRLGTVTMKDTALNTWSQPNGNLTWVNNSSFTVSSAPVPEPSGAALLLSGGAALALRNRRRYYSAFGDKLTFDKKGKCKGINRE